MVTSGNTIKAAFEQHRRRYAEGERAWDAEYHLDLWRRARSAYENDSEEEFSHVYEQLRRYWQAFRGGKSHWDLSQTFQALRRLDRSLFTLRLRDLEPANLDMVYAALTNMQGLKVNTDGPSIVALSKVLHFWNPRLFIIVDQGVMWNWVLSHRWLWDQIQPVRAALDQKYHGGTCKRSDGACDVMSYLAILAWAADFARQNPAVLEQFGHLYGGANPGVKECDAIAVEWFLLGVVELPPPGVSGLRGEVYAKAD